METETTEPCTKDWHKFTCNMKEHVHCHGSVIYCMGLLGALVYYLTTATSLWGGVVGVIKAIFWPAVLVYGALKFLGM